MTSAEGIEEQKQEHLWGLVLISLTPGSVRDFLKEMRWGATDPVASSGLSLHRYTYT